MTDAGWELRAHDDVHERLDVLADAVVPDELWDASLQMLRRVKDDPDSSRRQAIRWPQSQTSGWRVSVRSGKYEVQVWCPTVQGQSYVWGLTFDPELGL